MPLSSPEERVSCITNPVKKRGRRLEVAQCVSGIASEEQTPYNLPVALQKSM